MDSGRIACFDVYYHPGYARACSIVFQTAPCEKVISSYCALIKQVHAYVPGEFYKRELPCLLQVFALIEEEINLIIIDGYVVLGSGRKGLGGYLFEALDKKIPVIGVAKTFFTGCVDLIEVYRGSGNRPLYVSSIGIDLELSAKLISNLQGNYRIPEVLKTVDRLSREKDKTALPIDQ